MFSLYKFLEYRINLFDICNLNQLLTLMWARGGGVGGGGEGEGGRTLFNRLGQTGMCGQILRTCHAWKTYNFYTRQTENNSQ